MKQLNPIKFHLDKRARVWDSNIRSRIADLVFLPSFYINNGTIHVSLMPSFSLILDTATTAYAFLCDKNDNWVLDIADPIIVDKTTYKQVYYSNEAQSFQADGYYYITLNVDGVNYYSDMFCLTSDVSKLLKIKVTSADITVGGVTQAIQQLYSTEFYLSASYYGYKPKVDEKGNTINGVISVLSGTSVYPREFEIDANENIYRYLYSLRQLGCNGTVEITWEYETFNATDFLVEEIQNNYKGTYQLKLTFVCEDESVQTLNAIT